MTHNRFTEMMYFAVKLHLENYSEIILLSVYIIGGSELVSRNKPTKQESIAWKGFSRQANDGDTNGYYFNM